MQPDAAVSASPSLASSGHPIDLPLCQELPREHQLPHRLDHWCSLPLLLLAAMNSPPLSRLGMESPPWCAIVSPLPQIRVHTLPASPSAQCPASSHHRLPEWSLAPLPALWGLRSLLPNRAASPISNGPTSLGPMRIVAPAFF
jgi:hypothetical protein